jgi:hypothetical protein
MIKVYSNKGADSLPILVGYKGSTSLPKDEAYPFVELREENGKVRAYDAKGKEVRIPSFPKSKASLNEWLHGCSPRVLEAARLYYHDKWLWDSGDDKYRDLVRDIEAFTRIRYTQDDAPIIFCPYVPHNMPK